MIQILVILNTTVITRFKVPKLGAALCEHQLIIPGKKKPFKNYCYFQKWRKRGRINLFLRQKQNFFECFVTIAEEQSQQFIVRVGFPRQATPNLAKKYSAMFYVTMMNYTIVRVTFCPPALKLCPHFLFWYESGTMGRHNQT